MSNVLVDRDKIDILANAISIKSGEPLTLTLDEMVEAVDGIETGGGGITPTGNINITQAGTTDVTNYATATVPSGSLGTEMIDISKTSLDYDIDITFPDFSAGYISTSPTATASLDIEDKSVSPSISQQVITPTDTTCYLNSVTVSAMPTGTAGTPTATKGAVSNHSISVTPSVTNTAGYISGGTKTGAAVTVSASELVSGSETKTANGTYDVTNLAELVVNVSGGGGSSKNAQVVQGTTRTTSSTLTAIGAEMTVSKTGTYDVYWSAFRSSTSSSYTYGTQLYIDGSAHGTQNTTWSNHVQNNHLTNVSLTQNQKIRVYGRNSRGSSYYIYAPTLVIVEV